MARHLHDGPSLYSSAPVKKPAPHASLSALQWAADRAGLSYGRFMQGLDPADELRIQAEYDEWRRRPVQERMKSHSVEEKETPSEQVPSESHVDDSEKPAEEPPVSGAEQRVGELLAVDTWQMVDIATLRSLLDGLPSKIDIDYYNRVLDTAKPLTKDAVYHEAMMCKARRTMWHKSTNPQRLFLKWLRG